MFKLIDQPFGGQLGTILKEKLSDDKYKYFIIVSAFAKNSGVLRIKESLKDFRDRDGKIEAFVGLDVHGTSYEALVNLFSLVDSLYIVHDSNPSITFHSKIYYLTDLQDSDWIAVGSNNLTGGGLWTNHETASILTKEGNPDQSVLDFFSDFHELIRRFKKDTCDYSIKINSIEDLDKLLEADLLRHEIQLQIDAARSRKRSSGISDNRPTDPFGSIGHIHIPRVKGESKGKPIKVTTRNTEVTSIQDIAPSDNSEKMWFETREMTGGSRNILDLSMLGNLIQGSGDRTRYQTDKDNTVLGSVVFFDVDPSNTAVEKEVTINYNAKDYSGCTIKMHQSGANPNGSWRIQLKGETTSGDKLTTAEDGEWFVHKIIVLEKIKTDYYVMSVLPESELDSLKSQSIFVARNGRTPTSKQYGLLDI